MLKANSDSEMSVSVDMIQWERIEFDTPEEATVWIIENMVSKNVVLAQPISIVFDDYVGKHIVFYQEVNDGVDKEE